MNYPYRLLCKPGQFACINSGDGFISCFDAILRPYGYVYAVKGGPGTGKSGLLSHIASEADRRGERAVRIFCSSDPSSLDGVLLPDRSVALVDATAPHIYEPKTPGVDGEYIDLGAFRDGARLRARKDGIAALNAAKSAAYRRAFDALSAAARLKAAQKDLLFSSVRRSAFDKAVRRAAACADKERAGAHTVRPLAAVGMDGWVKLSSPGEQPDRVLTLPPSCGAEELFLSALSNELSGVSLFVSPDPLTRAPERLYLPASRAEFRVRPPLGDEREKVLAPWKLFAPSPDERRRIRSYERCVSDLSALAAQELQDVKKAHFALEEIYKASMDFSAVDALKVSLAGQLFGATSL